MKKKMKRESFGLKAAQTNHKGNKFHQSKFGVQISIFLIDLGASIAGNYSTKSGHDYLRTVCF